MGIGKSSVFEYLKQQIEDIAVGFFDLIKQKHAVGHTPYTFGQLSSLVVTDITRRRADKTRNTVLFHIFRHVKSYKKALRTEKLCGKCAAKLCFSDPTRTGKNKRSYRPARVGDAEPTAAYCCCNGFYCLVLTYHAGFKP